MSTVMHRLPASIQRVVRNTYAAIVLRARSAMQAKLKRDIFGELAPFVPPLHRMQDGKKDYRDFYALSLESRDLFLKAGLQQTDAVLDIGCGVGRQFLQLLPWLKGEYQGVDPVYDQISWCEDHITPRFQNFHFLWADLHSKLYNPTGKIKPSEWEFPYPANHFDFCFLGSVHTHMFPSDVRHYMSEISRVLKPGGRGLITYFLLNSESEKNIATGKSTLNFVYPIEEGSKMTNGDRMENAIAHREENILQMYEDSGLKGKIVSYGKWSGRNAEHYQDIVLVTKNPKGIYDPTPQPSRIR